MPRLLVQLLAVMIASAASLPAAAPPEQEAPVVEDRALPGEFISRGGGFELRGDPADSSSSIGAMVSAGGRFTLIGGMSSTEKRSDSANSPLESSGAGFEVLSDDDDSDESPADEDRADQPQ